MVERTLDDTREAPCLRYVILIMTQQARRKKRTTCTQRGGRGEESGETAPKKNDGGLLTYDGTTSARPARCSPVADNMCKMRERE
jgi:hypothetical protein